MWRSWEWVMSSTRSFKSPGIFAADAATIIPPTPIAGVAYRDTVTGTADVENGWRYGTRVESQDWNQIMYMVTSMLGMIDTQGVLGWSSDVDYTGPALVFGSDGQLYIKIGAASGPNNGGAKDPISNPTYWQSFVSRFSGSPGDIKLAAYSTPPTGWLKCNGAAVSRTTYADLFAAIGTTFGAGNGTTTFNLPETRSEFPRGADDGRGIFPAGVLGSYHADSFQNHHHGAVRIRNTGTLTGTGSLLDATAGFSADSDLIGNATTSPEGGTIRTGNETRPRNVVLMFFIKT